MYYGNDYLPAIYQQRMSDTNRYSFIIVSNDADVGFFSLSRYKIDEIDVFVEQALRLRHDVRGLNISKAVTKWIGYFVMEKSKKPILLTMSMLMATDYNSAMSSAHKNKIDQYATGTDTRKVIDTGLFAKIPVTQAAMEHLEKFNLEPKYYLKTIPNDMILIELNSLNFDTVTYVAPYDAYILRQNFYPFLINLKSSVDLLITGNPNLSKRANMQTLRSENVVSIGAINPVGYEGQWNVSIDLYGSAHWEFLSHLTNHAQFFIDGKKNVFNLRINIPFIENIEDTDFCRQLSKLKTDHFWFTPNFVNFITTE